MRTSSLATVLVAAMLAASGCRPKFAATGALTVDGEAFVPVACHVLAPRSTGVTLGDARGRWLSLELPPQQLDAWRELRGTPAASLTLAGQPARELGPCGTLEMEGEGYHGEGKRACGGSVSADCAAVKGALTFSGCF